MQLTLLEPRRQPRPPPAIDVKSLEDILLPTASLFGSERRIMDHTAADLLPRIVPTPGHTRALAGSWRLDDDEIRMGPEPGTGVLVALNSRGERINPLRVISRGRKVG